MRAVAQLKALDPTTTEVVRLRGAVCDNCPLRADTLPAVVDADGDADERVVVLAKEKLLQLAPRW